MQYYKAPACGCADCADSCPVPVFPPTSELCKVGDITCLDFICIILFSTFAIVFLTVLLAMNYAYRKANKIKEKVGKKEKG